MASRNSSFSNGGSDHGRSHQGPIRSNKGGYLRLPFRINPTFAELAESRVAKEAMTASTRRGGHYDGGSKLAVQADPDGLHRDDGDGDGGRPWTRAGVGATKLSNTAKRSQQTQAEVIYGSEAISLKGSADQGREADQLFAVDTREKMALQQVVPRRLREDLKRSRNDGGSAREERDVPRNRSCLEETVAEEVVEEEPVRGSAMRSKQTGRGSSCSAEVGGDKQATQDCSRTTSYPSQPQRSSAVDVGMEQQPSINCPSSGGPPMAELPVSRPRHRIQMLDEMRNAALFGKKKKSRQC